MSLGFPLEFFGQLLPGRSRRRGAYQRDMSALAMQASCREQSFFEGRGKIKPRILPDIGNRDRWIKKQSTTVIRQADAWTDWLIGKMAGEQRGEQITEDGNEPDDELSGDESHYG